MKTCDNANVSVIVTGTGTGTGDGYPDKTADDILLIKRAGFPPGRAGIAGHVFDDHASYDAAAECMKAAKNPSESWRAA